MHTQVLYDFGLELSQADKKWVLSYMRFFVETGVICVFNPGLRSPICSTPLSLVFR